MKQKKDIHFQKDQIVQVSITDIADGGEGIGKVEGFTLFIKDAVPGDTVRAKIMKAKKNYAFAKLVQIVTPSPWRVSPRCPVARQCGGCQIQELSYARQLVFKQDKVKNDLIRIGGFAPEDIEAAMEPIVGMEDPWRFRNKAQMPVGVGRNSAENPATGFYAGRTHSIIPVEDCLISSEDNQEIMKAVLRYMREFHVSTYDEETGKGLVRHVLIRSGFHSGQKMVCLIINGSMLPHPEALIKTLSAIPGMTCIALNSNTEKTNVIMGDVTRTLWGEDAIEDSLHILRPEYEENMDPHDLSFTDTGKSVTFRISPRSFYQVNPGQTQKLYSLALDFANLTGKETVWDIYCGVGTISLFLAGFAGEVYGVEIIPEAIADARRNAAMNGMDNVTFEVGKAEEILPQRLQTYPSPDVVVVDPPRKGCDEMCLKTILTARPDRIVYVSCDPATLARDLRILCDGGYTLKRVRPVDQFGHSVHVETVVLLSKGNVDSRKVKVEFSLEEMNTNGFQKGATYREITDWVQEKYGFHVTNLNIAQVKQKHGIVERENYNKPKSENSRQPGCPEEKVKAIEEAFRYFQMI